MENLVSDILHALLRLPHRLFFQGIKPFRNELRFFIGMDAGVILERVGKTVVGSRYIDKGVTGADVNTLRITVARVVDIAEVANKGLF